nr:AI-2E family transporter [Neoroseomonas soli]
MVLAVLHLGREVFIPMALALLLSVVLIPPARLLQRIGLPRPIAVALLLVVSLAAIGSIVLLVTSQVLTLAAELPSWEANLRQKLHALAEGSGVLDRAAGTLRRLSEEIGRGHGGVPAPMAAAPASGGAGALETVLDMAGMIAAPAASLAVALLLMAYLLMQREDVRDRFLRLAGLHDLHRTTRAMADATDRIGRYLLMQMMLNAAFGMGMGLALTVIGVPNAPLWGVLAFVLRFIPFLGVWIALSLPLIVAFATGKGWTEPLLVLLAFAIVDGLVTHVLEPLLYGRSTGLTPLALLVSSAVWTVLWGPIGLLLAPPITACLVILGRHVPALGFLEILLGNGEALPAPLRFYQRFLAHDPEGAQEIAEEHAEAEGPGATLRDLVLPAVIALGEDRAGGVLSAAAAARIGDGLTAVAEALVSETPAGNTAVRVIGIAGPADRALAGCAGAMATLRGWRQAEEGEAAEVAILCAVQPVSAPRLRRARAIAQQGGRTVLGLAPDASAAAQLAAELAPAPVLRGLDALASRLGTSRQPAAAELSPEGEPAIARPAIA